MENKFPPDMPPLPVTTPCPPKNKWIKALIGAIGGATVLAGGTIFIALNVRTTGEMSSVQVQALPEVVDGAGSASRLEVQTQPAPQTQPQAEQSGPQSGE